MSLISENFLHRLSLKECFDLFFKSKFHITEINDIEFVIKNCLKDKINVDIKLYFLMILDTVGIYSFLCLSHVDKEFRSKMLEEIRKMIKNNNFENQREDLIKKMNILIHKLRKKNTTFYITPLFKREYNKIIKKTFKELKCSRILIKKNKGKIFDNLSDSETNEKDQNNQKNDFENKLKRKLKKFGQKINENINDNKGKFIKIFFIRDFAFEMFYDLNYFLEIKKINLNSTLENKVLIRVKYENKENIQNNGIIRDFFKNLNEPGGLFFLMIITNHFLLNSDSKNHLEIINGIIFSLNLHSKYMGKVFKVLDCFDSYNFLIIDLANFIIEIIGLNVKEIFLKMGFEHLIITFILGRFGEIANSLSVVQFIAFLKHFINLFEQFNEETYALKYLLYDYREGKNEKTSRPFFKNNFLIDYLSENKRREDFEKKLKHYYSILKYIQNSSNFYIKSNK